MNKTLYLLVASALLAVGSPTLHAQTYELYQARQHVSGRDTLPYRLLEPAGGAQPGKKYPLVLFLHGAGERGSDNYNSLYNVAYRFAGTHLRSAYPCYVIVPQCPRDSFWVKYRWNGTIQPIESPSPTRPMALVIELLEKSLKELPVDLDRVYLSGISMGGFGSFDLVQRRPELFAAVMPICGGGVPSTAKRFAHIPTWVSHGADDQVVPEKLSREMVAALQAAGGTPIYTSYEGAHHDSWSATFPQYTEMPWIYDWLFAQRRQKQ